MFILVKCACSNNEKCMVSGAVLSYLSIYLVGKSVLLVSVSCVHVLYMFYSEILKNKQL